MLTPLYSALQMKIAARVNWVQFPYTAKLQQRDKKIWQNSLRCLIQLLIQGRKDHVTDLKQEYRQNERMFENF